ncbi:MAG: hypothetical protein HYR60_33760 [Acidobacteria bacterium]|nr:hypothetical protein [Acidobacteriota bacterium]
MPPAEFKQAESLAKQTNRSLTGLFREGLKHLQAEQHCRADEYTPHVPFARWKTLLPARRRFIDARTAEGLEDFEKGRFCGPFNTADEAIASMEANLKERAVRRALFKQHEARDLWQARINRAWRFCFTIEGDTYRIQGITPHPK